MATGKCINIGMGCSKALGKEIQEVDSANFVCSECGGKLIPVSSSPTSGDKDRPKKGGKTTSPEGPNWKIIAGSVAAAALLGGGAYFAFSGGGESITLNKTTASVFEGDVDTLKAIVKPEDAGYTLRWASNNPDVATVDNGVVTFHTSGEVKIGVQVNENKELKAFCDYIVKSGPGGGGDTILANWIKFMDSNQALKVGETKKLSLDCDPGNANEPVIWTSSNPDVVTVEYGKLTAIAPGTAKITATTKIGKKTDNIQVVVKGGTNPPPVELDYGKYTGESKNGRPHGQGRLVYTKEHIINKHDVKKRKAQPGEYIQGQFVNGEITIGKHFDASGNLIQALNFGVAE